MSGEPLVRARVRVRTERLEVTTLNAEEAKLNLVNERTKANKERFLKELSVRLGLLYETCRVTNITPATVRNWAKSDEEFRESLNTVKEETIDKVEGKLYVKIQGGDTASIIFYLKTKAKGRGYSQRFELSGADGGPLELDTTIRISELQKELPQNVLDGIMESVFGEKPAIEAVTTQVTKLLTEAVEQIVEAEDGYLIGDEEQREALTNG